MLPANSRQGRIRPHNRNSRGAIARDSVLPQGYSKTVHWRFQQWRREETLRRVLTELANTLREEGEIDESDCFIDATVVSSSAVGRGLFS